MYPWGNTAPDQSLLNYNQNVGDTTAVGHYSPQGDSPYGVQDMAGNVWQWVADWYDAAYYRSSPTNNPTGPSSGQFRVLRGGGWSGISDFVRAAIRCYDSPTIINSGLGFRCSVSPGK